jgi:hypothetical protein
MGYGEDQLLIGFLCTKQLTILLLLPDAVEFLVFAVRGRSVMNTILQLSWCLLYRGWLWGIAKGLSNCFILFFTSWQMLS